MDTVIELSNVTKTFKDFKINNVSFQIKKGFVTGFVGANGTGKSTIIKLIMNLLQPDNGEIHIFGLDYKTHEKEIKEHIAFVYDDHVFYENLTLNNMKKIIAPLYNNWDEELFKHYVIKFQIPLTKKLKTFSKGMLMKSSLAIALSHHAKLIIMDEPTAGLDPIFRREFLAILHELVEDEEKTIFFSTHITSDLEHIADYIVFLHDGKIQFVDELLTIDENFTLVKGSLDLLDRDIEKEFISLHKTELGFEGLAKDKKHIMSLFGNLAMYESASLEDIMFYTKKRSDTFATID